MCNQATSQKVDDWIELCRNLYNTSLEQRITFYKRTRKTLSYFDQCKEIPELREGFPEYKEIDVQLLRDVLERLKRAYDGFFRRMSTGGKAGFPRFKVKDRYKSFALHENSWKLDGKYLIIKKLGKFKIRLSRPIEGDIKLVTIKKTTDKFYVIFSCVNVPNKKKLKFTSKKIGIDMGIISFCSDSKGKKTDNPLYFQQSAKLLRRRQRSRSRKEMGSQNIQDAKLLVAKVHDKIERQRDFFLHQIANYYIQNYGNIFVEDLKIDEMTMKYFAKNVYDSSWGKFFQILSYKAEDAGRKVTKVNPQYTSQMCSSCGEMVEKSLAVRIHRCPHCGLVKDRDVNSAINILRVGQTRQTLTWDRSPSVV
jgi:putative transposase